MLSLQIQEISMKISNPCNLYLYLRKGFVPIQGFENKFLNAFPLQRFFPVINSCQIKYFCSV